MLKIRDIDEAKTIFKGWDNNHMWDTPSLDFLEHTKKKARENGIKGKIKAFSIPPSHFAKGEG